MLQAMPTLENENARLNALQSCRLLDTETEADFDALTELAAKVCHAPFAFISLVDRERVWYKSRYGVTGGGQSIRERSTCALAICTPGFFEIPDLVVHPFAENFAVRSKEDGGKGYRSYHAAKLNMQGHEIGTLCVLDTQPRTLNDSERQGLELLANQVMMLIELRVKRHELEAALRDVERMALTDTLTGLANRRHLTSVLSDEVARGRRNGTPMSVALLDLDHFKQINDRFGHLGGDLVLVQMGKLLRDSVRDIDLAARFGGEELCVVLPNTNSNGALTWAEHFVSALRASRFDMGTTDASVTASIGICCTDEHANLQVDGLLQKADEALYHAKKSGRDRIVLARDLC